MQREEKNWFDIKIQKANVYRCFVSVYMFSKSNLLQQKRKLFTELQKWFYDMTENQKIHY